MEEAPIETVAPEPPKKEKKKREVSPEAKAKLLANLAKAREKAAANRKARKEAKMQDSKAKEAKVTTKKVTTDVRSEPAKVTKPAEIDPRDIELAQLREKVKTMTLQDVVKKPKKRSAIKKVKSAATGDTDDEENQVRAEATRPSPQKTVRIKSPEPSPEAPKKQSTQPREAKPSVPTPRAAPVKRKKQLFGKQKRRR